MFQDDLKVIEDNSNGYLYEHLKLKEGIRMSVQAGENLYSTPSKKVDKYEYTEFEVSFIKNGIIQEMEDVIDNEEAIKELNKSVNDGVIFRNVHVDTIQKVYDILKK